METRNVILSGFGWEAEISPEYGMNPLRLTFAGKDIFRAPEEGAAPGSAVYGSALLMPPNRTAGGRFTFDGREYQLPVNEPKFGNHLHGSLSKAPFTVLRCTDMSVTAVLENRGALFPFPFRLTVCCALDGDGFLQKFEFENTGSLDMPLTFGLHTNFVSPELLQVPLDREWVRNECYIPVALGPLREENRVFCTGAPVRGRVVSGFFTAAGHTARLDRVTYTVSENFNQWILWNGDGTRGFVSVEPQCGAVNALNSGHGLLRLQPGRRELFTARVSVEPQ